MFDDQDIIDELEELYKHVGRTAIYNHATAPVNRDCTVQASLSSQIRRCVELEKYLTDAGYEYDWFKGWTKDMVTTPTV